MINQFRKPSFKTKFNDITVEYKNGDGSNGDWFRFKNGSVHKYVYGWANGHIEFYIIDVKKLVNCLEKNWSASIHNRAYGTSCFKAISIQTLKDFGAIDNHILEILDRKEEILK